jgi:putative transposase
MPDQASEHIMRTNDCDLTEYRKRCRRLNVAGHAHALTFSCFHGQPFLSRDRSRHWMVEAIAKARAIHQFHLWAYVLMPEHVHLLIHPTSPEYSISAILFSLKQPVSRRAVRFVRQHAPQFLARMRDSQPNGKVAFRFWQRGGGYDRNLWEARYIWETIDYIHANPVRRGLCGRAEDWYWSSASDYVLNRPGPLVLDRTTLPEDSRV